MSNSIFQTRDQKFASLIYQQIQAIKQQPVANQKRYGVMAHKLPVLIRTAGLAQAVIFALTRTDNESKLLIQDLNRLLEIDLKEQCFGHNAQNLSNYIYLTQQVLDALLWYKRFAQSELDVDSTDQADEMRGNGE